MQTKDKRLTTEVIKPDTKRHKGVIVPELELALKEFVLTYQHRTTEDDQNYADTFFVRINWTTYHYKY